jgi:hypothetical protein
MKPDPQPDLMILGSLSAVLRALEHTCMSWSFDVCVSERAAPELRHVRLWALAITVAGGVP